MFIVKYKRTLTIRKCIYPYGWGSDSVWSSCLGCLGTCNGTVSLHRLSLLSAGCLLVTGLSFVPQEKWDIYLYLKPSFQSTLCKLQNIYLDIALLSIHHRSNLVSECSLRAKSAYCFSVLSIHVGWLTTTITQVLGTHALFGMCTHVAYTHKLNPEEECCLQQCLHDFFFKFIYSFAFILDKMTVAVDSRHMQHSQGKEVGDETQVRCSEGLHRHPSDSVS